VPFCRAFVSSDAAAYLSRLNRHDKQRTAAPLRLALTKREAAEALGCSVDSLERHILHELRIVRRGALRLIPVTELQAFLERNAERTLADL
jgi:excisionase family DNA binding protein